MSKTKNEVLVILALERIENKEKFEDYLKGEGFDTIEDEPFAYKGVSSTPFFNTQAYVFEVFFKAFNIPNIHSCKLIIQIGVNPAEVYLYKKDSFFEKLS